MRHRAAVRRAEAMGFTYRPMRDILEGETLEEVVQRVLAVMDERTPKATIEAVLGAVERPATLVSTALEDIYFDEIVRDELRVKSEDQRTRWKNKKRKSVENFTALNGELRMEDINRDHAKKLYQFWLDRIAPRQGAPTHSASSGNRDMGNMRQFYDAYFRHMGEERPNPFANLSFSEKNKRSRPPFTEEWLREKILAPGALSGLNSEARAVVLVMMETGARLGEVANLYGPVIRLDHEVPHIQIEPRYDPEDPREIKTASSIRSVPLVGVALAALKAHPDGFSRYKDKETTLSNTLNKYFRTNGLFPTAKHTVYSLRHAFEDRMKHGNLDEELRRIIMGHTIDRPKYGSGGSLKWRQQQLEKIKLPFDPAVV